MTNILRIEEAAQFAACCYLFHLTTFAWWWFPALILAPDLSMIGYIINTKIGANTYNIAHRKAIALAVFAIGIFFFLPWMKLGGIILFAHRSMDRLLGYGLKYPDNFKHTHLGWIGKQNV